jgi:AbrB family looped-hinge helix DNA binding protein
MENNAELEANVKIQDTSYSQDEVIHMSESSDSIEMGTVSSRGQIAIPSNIREKMRLKEGGKVLFFLDGDNLLMKKVESMSWKEITEPLHKAKKKIREEDVVALVHKIRKEKD